MPKNRIILIVLAVSLIANVALLARGGNPPPHIRRQPMVYSISKFQLDSVLRSLDKDRRQTVREGMEKEFAQLRSYAETTGKERAAATKLLLEPRFDTETVARHFTGMREAQAASEALAQQMMLKVFEKLTAEERQNVLQRMDRRPDARRHAKERIKASGKPGPENPKAKPQKKQDAKPDNAKSGR